MVCANPATFAVTGRIPRGSLANRVSSLWPSNSEPSLRARCPVALDKYSLDQRAVDLLASCGENKAIGASVAPIVLQHAMPPSTLRGFFLPMGNARRRPKRRGGASGINVDDQMKQNPSGVVAVTLARAIPTYGEVFPDGVTTTRRGVSQSPRARRLTPAIVFPA